MEQAEVCSHKDTYCKSSKEVPGSRVPSSLSHRSKERTTSHGDGSKEVPRGMFQLLLVLAHADFQ